jgi:hypothetical protein
LKALLERGVVERVERFENGKQKASVYKIIGRNAPCYRNAKPAASEEAAVERNADSSFAFIFESFPPGNAQNVIPILQEQIKETLPSKRETDAAVIAGPANGENPDEVWFDSEKAPAVMRETLDYFLLKTGRMGITPEELSALCCLEKIHTPQRVNKEIAEASERFRQLGRPLSKLTLIYIYKSLRYQNSLKNVYGKAPLTQEIYGENLPDPYAGAYL